MTVLIYMCQPDAKEMARKGKWSRRPASLPIIQPYPISLGNLMFADASRYPDDPIYEVETIGM